MLKIPIVIPVHNESCETIASVVRAVLGCMERGVSEVVIAYASEPGMMDNKQIGYNQTQIDLAIQALGQLYTQYTNKVFLLPVRKGKGNGLIDAREFLEQLYIEKKFALPHSFFCFDSDLEGLTSDHVQHVLNTMQILEGKPVRYTISGSSKKFWQVISQRMLGRHLSGMRSVRLDHLKTIRDVIREKRVTYSIESLLNLLVKEDGERYAEEELIAVSQRDKSDKLVSGNPGIMRQVRSLWLTPVLWLQMMANIREEVAYFKRARKTLHLQI
jgi:hypothetical protein